MATITATLEMNLDVKTNDKSAISANLTYHVADGDIPK